MTNKNYKEKETQKSQKAKNNKKVKISNNKKIKKKSKKNKGKIVLKVITLIALFVGLCVFALVSPIFNISKINISGNNQISSDTIISLSELSEGNNIFKFNKISTKQKIKTNAYVENVRISRKLPNTINIEVEERNKNYNVEYLNGYAYINSQGYILEISENKENLPTIQGLSTTEKEMVAGERLNEQDLSALSTVIEIFDTCKNYNLDTLITSINVENPNEIKLYIESEKKTIHLGDNSNLNTKILYIQAIVEKNKDIEGDIYVNGEFNNKLKAIFREKV